MSTTGYSKFFGNEHEKKKLILKIPLTLFILKLILLNFQANTQVYLCISDNPTHTQIGLKCLFLHLCSIHLIFGKGEENIDREKKIN